MTGVQTCALPIYQITLSDGALSPSTDNDIDLGTSSLEFKDAFFDGTVRMDAIGFGTTSRSEERRVGKECRSRW